MSNYDPTVSFVTPRVAAGVLFTDERERILMVVPTYKDYLDIPGGYVEAGETPHQAAEREVEEELGIAPTIGRLLTVDWWVDRLEDGEGSKLLLVFDGHTLSSSQLCSISPAADEIATIELHAPDDLDAITVPRLANRLRHALNARLQGTFHYLENGHPDTP